MSFDNLNYIFFFCFSELTVTGLGGQNVFLIKTQINKKCMNTICVSGENMKQLELSAEKAVEREEKLKDKILNIQHKYKAAEGR